MRPCQVFIGVQNTVSAKKIVVIIVMLGWVPTEKLTQ